MRYVDIAKRVSHWCGRPTTFLLALGVIVTWIVTGPIFSFSDTWQLVINTATTIVTFLLVALVQNQSTRADAATQQKLNALIEATLDQEPSARSETVRRQLREAIGVERRESS